MANIRKSFNFRNGVQVDNDNFVVNANGLVGIGTSVPQTYLLNVYGDTRTTGLTTTRDLYTQNVEISGIATVGFVTATTSYIGILTVSQIKVGNSDIVDNLIGYARTTFITDNGGVGLHTTSKIGINTTTSPGASDPELSVIGNVDVTGIITATTFDGDLTGDVNSSGVSTFTELKVGTAITMSAGIITATTFSGSLLTSSLTGTISTTQIADGAVTDAKIDTVSASKLTGALPTISGAALTSVIAEGITGSPNVNLGVTTTGNLTAGSITGAGLSVTSIGIGTSSPTDALHIQQSGTAEIYVGSDSAASSLRVGRNLDDNTSGMVKYGNTSGAYPLSTENSLDFMNFGWGNVNFYLQAGITTTSDLNFNWNVGGFNNLMTLTKGGNLGIGITNPSQTLNVQGISTFTGNANFDQNVTIVGALSANSLTLTQSLTANVTGDILSSNNTKILESGTDGTDALLTGNVNTASGISTFNQVLIDRVGIGTTAVSNNASLFVNGSVRARRGISIGTTDNPKCSVDMSTIVGIDTTFAYMIPPKVTTSQRDGLTNQSSDPLGADEAGATIYNISTNKLQTWNGSSWNDCF